MPEIDIDGLQLAYSDHGSGPPIFAIHGFGGAKSVWQPQIEAFTRSRRFIAIDMPGHGDSGRPVGDRFYSPAACAVYARRLLDRLGIQQAILLGQSMGTLISQMIYHADPSCVKALVLTGALAKSPPAGTIAGVWTEKIVQDIETNGIEDYLDRNSQYWFAPGFDAARIKDATVDSYKLAGHAAASYCRAMPSVDIRDKLGAIRVPTLIIDGSMDGRTPIEEGEIMNRQIPDCCLKLIKGAGHLVNVERPDAFNKAVLGFIKEHS